MAVMDQTIQLKDCFCVKYLGNKELFPEIKSQTIEVLIDNGFDSFPTLMAMDFFEDLPQMPELNFGQKALIRKGLGLLQEEYEQNFFDYENAIELKDVFDKIYRKLNFKPIVGRKRIYDCYLNPDFTQIRAKNCLKLTDSSYNLLKVDEKNGLKDSLQEINIDVSHSAQRITVPEIDSIEENLKNDSVITSDQSSDESSEESDIQTTDYLFVKSSMDAIKYEALKKTVKERYVKVIVKRYNCDVLSSNSDT